jgi:hypothetical protein
MKALTIRQPFAHLIVTGRKRLETRKWLTSYRGPLLIHAARSVHEEPIPGVAIDLASLPLGAIIGMVRLSACFSPLELTSDVGHRLATQLLTPTERSFGYFGPGWYAWELQDPVEFKTPLPCPGNINLWAPSRVLHDKILRLTPNDITRHRASELKSAS